MPNIFIAEETMLRKLRICMKNNWNVLFTGRHGVGKSCIIKSLWDSMGIKYKMFSASTMDPWVDFIGIPKEAEDETGKYLEFIRRKSFGDIEAIFFDEFSRSHKKIRNAVMELIQFKSINDEKFGKLKVVWAAINPDDEEDGGERVYDVEKLDPAQKDRFQVQINIPYEPVKAYFSFRYGTEVADTAVKWWYSLKKDENGNPRVTKDGKPLTDLVSPRRLDYALEVLLSDGPVEDVLPRGINCSEFKKIIKGKPLFAILQKLFESKNLEEAKTFLSDENVYDQVKGEILKNDDMVDFFIPLLPPEKINSLISSDMKVASWAMRVYGDYPEIEKALSDIKDVGTNRILTQQINKRFDSDKLKSLKDINKKPTINENPARMVFKIKKDDGAFDEVLKKLASQNLVTTSGRAETCKILVNTMPKEMTLDQSETVLEILCKIIEGSHLDTMDKRFPNFMELVNNCVENMYEKDYDFSKFKSKYYAILQYAVKFPGFFLRLAAPKSVV